MIYLRLNTGSSEDKGKLFLPLSCKTKPQNLRRTSSGDRDRARVQRTLLFSLMVEFAFYIICPHIHLFILCVREREVAPVEVPDRLNFGSQFSSSTMWFSDTVNLVVQLGGRCPLSYLTSPYSEFLFYLFIYFFFFWERVSPCNCGCTGVHSFFKGWIKSLHIFPISKLYICIIFCCRVSGSYDTNPSTWKFEAQGLPWVQAHSELHIVNSRLTWATKWDPISKD